jgi:lipopolysaccharide/colanic/teichoic acid biosynthesis glycosyltransferase
MIRIKLGTPIFFIQTRPGLHGTPFNLMKFRTMTDAKDAGGVLLPDAQRLTTFGRFLRATSLDELPELFNVLKGDMSLVGPRPLLMQYLDVIRRSRRGGTRCGRASPDGRRSTAATPSHGKRNSDLMFGMWIIGRYGWMSRLSG